VTPASPVQMNLEWTGPADREVSAVYRRGPEGRFIRVYSPSEQQTSWIDMDVEADTTYNYVLYNEDMEAVSKYITATTLSAAFPAAQSCCRRGYTR
jgi:hypothetical protein